MTSKGVYRRYLDSKRCNTLTMPPANALTVDRRRYPSVYWLPAQQRQLQLEAAKGARIDKTSSYIEGFLTKSAATSK